MDYGPNRPSCVRCGRNVDRGVALDAAGHCERCREETFAVGHGDSLRRGIVERLRSRYAEAQQWVVADAEDASSHSNLEWILGARRRGDEAALGLSVSELVVLWLEDLALQLEDPDVATAHGRSDAGAEARREAAEGLRIATRDFADAFLAPRTEACS